jgi:hypothetical protein
MISASCWKTPPLWKDSFCWIIGGGASILDQFEVPKNIALQIQAREIPLSTLSEYMGSMSKDHCIGVNSAYTIGPWIDFIFFGDYSWYLPHEKMVKKHPGMLVSCNPKFGMRDYGVKYLRRDYRKGITTKKGMVCWNDNSGAAAINLAYHLGVKQIRLLGFDMCTDKNNRTHWHGNHAELLKATTKSPVRLKGTLPYNRHLKCFKAIAMDAEKLGIEILNCNPESKITEFKKVSVKDLL